MADIVVFILKVIFFQALLFGLFCSYIASQKNRSGGVWFIFGFLFSVLALIAIASVPSLKSEPLSEEARNGKSIRCPFCAETIKAEAQICRFCHSKLTVREIVKVDKPKFITTVAQEKERLALEDSGIQLEDGSYVVVFQEGLFNLHCQKRFKTLDAAEKFAKAHKGVVK